jgi:hypothetical protein
MAKDFTKGPLIVRGYPSPSPLQMARYLPPTNPNRHLNPYRQILQIPQPSLALKLP